jgi:hypothetical protein
MVQMRVPAALRLVVFVVMPLVVVSPWTGAAVPTIVLMR